MASKDLVQTLQELIEKFRAEAEEAKKAWFDTDDELDAEYYWGSYETYRKCAEALENVLKESGVIE